MSSDIINLKDFEKLDFRIGKVIQAEAIEESDKLIKLEVDFGKETRTILTGMRQYYQEQDFVGKKLPFLLNLKPRKIMDYESQGMLLAVDVEGEPILFKPIKDVPLGSIIR
ncbi:MAG: methionine--tRNA ligase [Candidatus Moranbacteria bacterium]|nr:methionine--tRNA ligase [Candidatus Moranbacteria bacterium]